MRPGSLCLESSGTSKEPRRKTKTLDKEPTPLAIHEKLLADGGGPGIFVFFVGDPGEEGATPI